MAKFLNYKDREKILKSRRMLKGTRISIREDYSDRVAEKRSELIPKMLEERNNGKVAYLRYDKLIVHDKKYEQTRPVYYQSAPGPYPQQPPFGFQPPFSVMCPTASGGRFRGPTPPWFVQPGITTTHTSQPESATSNEHPQQEPDQDHNGEET